MQLLQLMKNDPYVIFKPLAGSLSSFQKSEFLKMIILIIHVIKLKNQCELDVKLVYF